MTNGKKITWFQLMWGNFYIQLFAVAIIMLVSQIYYINSFDSWGNFLIGISIPLMMIIMIGYLGFYKYWKEYSRLK